MAKGHLRAGVIAGILELPGTETSSTPTTLDDTYGLVAVNADSGAKIVNLPLGSTLKSGRSYWIKKTDASSNAITINRAGSDLIETGTTFVLNLTTPSVILVWSGTVWRSFPSVDPDNVGQSIVNPPILVAPSPSEVVFNDEFDSTTLDPAWTLSDMDTPTVAVDPTALFSSGNTRADLTTRPGWLLLQAPHNNVQSYLYRSISLGTDATVVIRVSGNTTYAGGTITGDNGFITLRLEEGFSDANLKELQFYDLDAGNVRFAYHSRLSSVSTMNRPTEFAALLGGHGCVYGAIIKKGTAYHGLMSVDGLTWQWMGSFTNSATLTQLRIRTLGASGNGEPNKIVGIDFVRVYNTARFF